MFFVLKHLSVVENNCAKGKQIEEDGEITAFRFRGGGFGHGAGMSQNGANHMAEAGKTYEEILGLFYEGTSISEI